MEIKLVVVWHTSMFACSSALASGAGIALAGLSRVRVFFTPSALILAAALDLTNKNIHIQV